MGPSPQPTAGPSGANASGSGTALTGSAKKEKKGAGGPPKSKAYANPLASKADEVKYRTKYRQLKGKVKEIEDTLDKQDNTKTQAKILKTKRQIQRLRLERSILYERFQEAKNAGLLNKPVPSTSVVPRPPGYISDGMQLDPIPNHLDLNGSTSASLPYNPRIDPTYSHHKLVKDASGDGLAAVLQHEMPGVDLIP